MPMYTARNYVKAESLAQAWELNQKRANAILGGGCWMRLGKRRYDTLIDLFGLGLDQIEDREDQVALGAMVTLRQLELSPVLKWNFGDLFTRCTQHIVGVQFRNCATLGGSVAARFGFSDILTALLALDCSVELVRGGIVPLEQYVTMERDRDVLVRVHVKKAGSKPVYQTVRNSQTDLPTLTCALGEHEGRYRAVIGARPKIAQVLEGASLEKLMAQAKELPYGSNMRAGADYRRHLAGVLLTRAWKEMEANQA